MNLPDQWRFPDKPVHSTLDFVKTLGSDYVAQPKMNGWRVLCYVNSDDVRIYTRQGRLLEDALKGPVDERPIEALKRLPTIGLSIFDGEYMGRRAVASVKVPQIVLFDTLKHNDEWITNWDYNERLILTGFYLESVCGNDFLTLIESSDRNFEQLYNKLKKDDEEVVEGIVVKAKKSTLIGDRKKSAINPEWFKARYEDEV